MLRGLRTYKVSEAVRRPLVNFMVDALVARGCRIIHASSPSTAPFIIVFETATGERHGVVAYAFRATRTPTRNRPLDERSFQIKYSSKESFNEHQLWKDPWGLFTTLLIGIDPDSGYFVAADPAFHNPTKFFIRLEFKDEHAEQITDRGWFAWERARRSGIRQDAPVEVLVGGTQDRFLDLVRFERAADGLSAGHRQLLAEKVERFVVALDKEPEPTALEVSRFIHPLTTELNLDSDQILELINSAKRLKMAVRGWVAEEHLRGTLEMVPGVSDCRRLDKEGGPDVQLRFCGGPLITIECKNVLRKVDARGTARIDFQRTRASKKDPCSRYYAASDFDVLAGCLHAVSESWEFKYVLPDRLLPHKDCPNKLSNLVKVDGIWSADAAAVLSEASQRQT